MSKCRTGAFLAGPILLALAAGCGDGGPKIVRVTGTLTHKGQPVAGAVLNFLPERGRQSWAQTDAQGQFKINYDAHQDGAVVGKHKVWLEYRPSAQTDQEAVMRGKAAPLSKELKELFDKYSYDNSTCEVQIDADTKVLKIDLE